MVKMSIEESQEVYPKSLFRHVFSITKVKDIPGTCGKGFVCMSGLNDQIYYTTNLIYDNCHVVSWHLLVCSNINIIIQFSLYIVISLGRMSMCNTFESFTK